MSERPLSVILIAALAAACTARDPEPVPDVVVVPPDYPSPIGPQPRKIHHSHVGEIRRNESLSIAVARLGVSPKEVDELVNAFAGVFDFRYAQPGHWFRIDRDPDGKLERFRYVASDTKVVVAFRVADGSLRATDEFIAVRTSTVHVRGLVDHSLYLAMDAAGEEPWLTLTLVDILAWDIDFFTETQKGDRFSIIVEKRSVGDKFVGYGNVLAATYTKASGESYPAFRYTLPDGRTGYYDDQGTAREKAFLKSPIKFASITSRYGMRRHPILRYRRRHKGVDYGAPMGTAIWAIGDGVVRRAGRLGGYGRVVIIRHTNGLESRYAHLRGYARGIRAGSRVKQKQVIGYVGKSGLATGPHLHFEVLRGGHHTNPLSIVVPPAPPIPQKLLADFRAKVAPLVVQINTSSSAVQSTNL